MTFYQHEKEKRMNNTERYEDAVRRLLGRSYEVVIEEQGYRVQHLTDHNDVSYARNLNDLVELADLMEWAGQQSVSRSKKRPQ